MLIRTKKLLLVMLVMGGSALEASATEVISPCVEWTFRVGDRVFGLEGYHRRDGKRGESPSIFRTTTVIHYGSGYSRVSTPVIVVAAVSGALPLLICAGCLLMIRRPKKRLNSWIESE